MESRDSSWTSHSKMAEVYYAEGRHEDAFSEAEMAIDMSAKQQPEHTPPTEDVLRLRLMLGNWRYAANEMIKAEANFAFVEASEDATVQQTMLARFGSLKVALSLSDAERIGECLHTLIAEQGKVGMAEILNLFAQDPEHDSIMEGLLSLCKENPDLVQLILGEIERVTSKDTAGRSLSQVVSGNDNFSESAVRGVLLQDRAVAAYFYKMLPKGTQSGTDTTKEAISLWKECLRELSGATGRNDFFAKMRAISGLANHYFQKAIKAGEHHVQYVSQLQELAKDDVLASSDAFTLLAALYTWTGSLEGRAHLLPLVKRGLQVLFDNIPENDVWGLRDIRQTHLLCNDFKNAAIALSLSQQGDFVSEAVALSLWENQRGANIHANDMGVEMIQRTVQVAKDQFPNSEHQVQRIKAALEHVESIMNTDFCTNDDTSHIYESVPTTFKHLQSGLEAALQRAKNPQSFQWRWCGGHLTGGDDCKNYHDFATPFYNCIYCLDEDFCKSCLGRLRNSEATIKVTVCNANHRWLKMPPLGDDMYVGTKASIVPLDHDIRVSQHDQQILEMVRDETCTQTEMTLDAWKEQLAKNWGISMDEIKSAADQDDC